MLILFDDIAAQPTSNGYNSRDWVFPTSILQRKWCLYRQTHCLLQLWSLSMRSQDLKIILQLRPSVFKFNLKRTVIFLLGKVPSLYSIANRTSYPALSLFTKVPLAFSCKLPKVACSRKFLLTRLDFCGNLSQQFNITYLLRVPARLLKEPEQVFDFLIAT